MTRSLQITLCLLEGVALFAILAGAFTTAALARLAFGGAP
jgi:hypothetical protein